VSDRSGVSRGDRNRNARLNVVLAASMKSPGLCRTAFRPGPSPPASCRSTIFNTRTRTALTIEGDAAPAI
jgi:hypothetical protein